MKREKITCESIYTFPKQQDVLNISSRSKEIVYLEFYKYGIPIRYENEINNGIKYLLNFNLKFLHLICASICLIEFSSCDQMPGPRKTISNVKTE